MASFTQKGVKFSPNEPFTTRLVIHRPGNENRKEYNTSLPISTVVPLIDSLIELAGKSSVSLMLNGSYFLKKFQFQASHSRKREGTWAVKSLLRPTNSSASSDQASGEDRTGGLSWLKMSMAERRKRRRKEWIRKKREGSCFVHSLQYYMHLPNSITDTSKKRNKWPFI